MKSAEEWLCGIARSQTGVVTILDIDLLRLISLIQRDALESAAKLCDQAEPWRAKDHFEALAALIRSLKP